MKGYVVFLGAKNVLNLVLGKCYLNKKVALKKAMECVEKTDYRDLILDKIDSGNKIIERDEYGNYFEF